jgi:peptidoglycan/xylan/chitin deacetylase (PgdA/CDA1 family)
VTLVVALVVAVALVVLVPVFDPRSSRYVATLHHGSRAQRTIALTFDDGPDPRFTPQVLDLLAAAKVPATFFVVGERALAHPDLVARIDREGHLVGNHGHTHGFGFHFGGVAAYARELDAFDRALAPMLGRACRFFRPPQGFRTPPLAKALRARDVVCVNWSRRGFDSVRRDANAILATLVAGLEEGAIFLLHDGAGLGGSHDRSPTLALLPRFIAEARQRGFTFVPLDELLGTPAYAPTR